MVNVVCVAEDIVIWCDLTTVLSTIIACSATFVAIIGGLIANKAITDRAEKESIERQLSQIDLEISAIDGNIESVSNWIIEYNAKEFIQKNIVELLDEKPLLEVYSSEDSNDIDYDELLPFWNDVLGAVKQFRANAWSEKNNEGIPKVIVNSLTPFQREICSMYKYSIADNEMSYYEKRTAIDISSSSKMIEYYNARINELEELIDKKENLVVREQILRDRKDKVCISHSVKKGINIFIIVSLMNIILPVVFMLFNPTSNIAWYITETAISIIAFSFGIIIMIVYICSLVPKKDASKSTEVKEFEQENE